MLTKDTHFVAVVGDEPLDLTAIAFRYSHEDPETTMAVAVPVFDTPEGALSVVRPEYLKDAYVVKITIERVKQ